MPPADLDLQIRTAMRALLAARAPGRSICPSEVARAVAPHDESAWRALMPRVRAAAVELARAGELRITRHGVTLSPDRLGGGPIRLQSGHRSG